MDFSIISFTGNITADAQIRDLPNNKHALNFTVACNLGLKANKTPDTIYHDCVLYDSFALAMQPHLKKGKAVAINGETKMNFYKDKEGKNQKHTYTVVRDLKLTGVKDKEAKDE